MPERQEHSVRRTRKETEMKKTPGSVVFLAFFLTAAIGYVGGTFNNQIVEVVGPVFGIKTYAGELDTSSLQETYKQLKANYDGTLDDKVLLDGANKGMVNAVGDAYTVYLNSSDSKDLDDALTGNIGGGIGAEIGLRSDQPTIVRVLDNNPAKDAGLLAGDTILKVNDDVATGWTVDQAVAKIRGEAGTTVKLQIKRGDETKEFTITRAVVTNPSVSTKIDGDIGIMTLSRFDEQTAGEARVAAQMFKKEGIKKVVLDLRNNGGGYLTAAQGLAGLWLNDKVVVTEKTRGQVTDQLKTDSNALLEGMPTVVLVNGNSASASEIVAGALHDYKVATLIGQKTFGKGSVQQLISLSGGAELKVTIAKWYTPNNVNINQQGIDPDKVVEMTDADSNAGRDPQLDAAKAFLQDK